MNSEQKRIMVGYNAYFTSDEVMRVAKEHAVVGDRLRLALRRRRGGDGDEAG